MSTPTAVAYAELAKVLKDHEDYLLSVIKSKAVDLSKKMFQSFLISDSMIDQFSSLDHNRVEPQLQLRYLLRLVTQRIQQDGSVGDKLLSLLESCGEHSVCEFVRRSISGDTQPGVTRECSDDSLGPEDMLWILEVLSEVSHKWENIAIALGLRTCQRKNIKGEDNIINLSDVLEVWLSGGSTKPHTINTLTQALNSQLVGYGRLATKLLEQFKIAKLPEEVSYITVSDTSRLPLTIICQSPREVEVEDGKSTLLLVQASHRENVSYQWNKNGQPLADNLSCTGIHGDILLINHTHQGTGGEYTCRVSSEEREVVSSKVTLTVLYPDEKKALLDLYSVNTRVSLEEAWPPVGADMFINLFLIKPCQHNRHSNRRMNKVLDKTEKVEYEEVFRAYRSGSLVLVEGRPGSGKTTLVHKLIEDWADGTALVHAKLVFLVSLRSLCSDQGDTLFSLLQPLYSSSGASLESVISAIEKKNGEGVCFVFDGLDEYHPQGKDKTVVFRLLHKSYLPLAMVIVSSRPGALARLRQKVVTQHIEVFGFTKEQIYEYIDKFPFGTRSDSSFGPTKLKEYLKSHPNVLDMCYLPIHAAIICFVYQTKRGHLPHTQTQIYTEFARSMILRHLKRKDTEVQLYSLKELPDSVCDSFSKLCLLAFNMTLEGKQVMNAREVSICEDTSPHGDWSLGLVTCNRTAQLYGVSTSYMFLHLTLQEFLAAYHIVNTEGEEKRELIEIQSQSHLTLYSMWTFYFGLETFESEKGLDIYHNVLSSSKTSTIYVFESQQKVVCDEVVRLHPTMDYLSDDVPSNIQALQFVISNSSHLIRGIVLDHSTLQQIQHLKFPELKSLDVIPVSRSVYTAISIDSTTVQYLSRILTSCTQLEYACLYFDNLQTEGGGCLADLLRYLVNLEDLTLRLFRINSDVSERTCPGLVLVLNQIHCLSRIKKLNISGWRMDLNCCKVLASNICQLNNIEYLTLCDNGIESDGAVCLASTFHHLTKLESLDLSRNTIGSDGAAHLVSSLHHCTTLKMLDLSNNNIGLDGATRLASQLHHLTKLDNLNLSYNNIGFDGAIRLASELHHLTELTDLSLAGSGIGVEGAIQVITGLKDCQKLTRVYLNVGFRISNLSFSNNFYLEGLVSSDESDIIGRIIAATKLHKRTIKLHLGFRTIIVLPLKKTLF